MDVETDDSSFTLNDNQIYCICRKTLSQYDKEEDDLMIECSACKDWLHGKCVQLSTIQASDIDQYVCPRCVTHERKIVYKIRKNYHRHDYADSNADRKPVQAGTQKFIDYLLSTSFLESNEIARALNGHELTTDYLDKHGFDYPILVESKDSLNLKMPEEGEFSLRDIETLVGSQFRLDVIDCERQHTFNMTLNELRTYFESKPRTKILNLISLEISKTPLNNLISIPDIVSRISWVSNGVWPVSLPENVSYTKPEVQKYCLLSAARSYTDFHVDFGGSSVWYHVLKGSKLFYLIEPTEENLLKYEKWYSHSNHTEIFLAKQVKKCYKLQIKAGDTLFLPCGWIHAVYTPEDSIVFGGNFETSYKIPLQIKIYEMENRLKVPEKFRFPYFATLQWYAAKHLLDTIKQFNKDRKCVQPYLLFGCKFLRDTLRKWLNTKDYYVEHGHEIPEKFNCEKLIKILNKELNKAEILLNHHKKIKKNSNDQRVLMKIKLPLEQTYDDKILRDEIGSGDLLKNTQPQIITHTSSNKRKNKKLTMKSSEKEHFDDDNNGELSDDEDKSKKKKKSMDAPNNFSSETQVKSKAFKKGYATTKQRLSKMLKINRILNI